MRQKLVVFGMCVAVPAAAGAQADRIYDCTSGGVVRQVEIAYPSGAPVPCEVRYYKDGVAEVLWSAGRQTGFCEAQAEGFVEQLQSMGWVCTERGAAPPPATNDDTDDDTDVLGAGER